MAIKAETPGPAGGRGVRRRASGQDTAMAAALSASPDDLLLAALERGDDTMTTGRHLMTFAEGQFEEGANMLRSQRVRMADARDFEGQMVGTAEIGDADALVFPEIGVALIAGGVVKERGLAGLATVGAVGAAAHVIEPEYFAFASNADYLRGFLAAATAIARDLQAVPAPEEDEIGPEVAGATWGLVRCRVPPSRFTGAGIKVAVLDTGFDPGHPDFVGRQVTMQSFIAGQAVQDLHGHGTHCIGTAAGPRTPAGTTPRYGTAHAAHIFVGKVLSNSGSGSTAGILAGINWAIANRCEVISMSLGSQSPVQAAYTAAGRAALDRGCLVIAAAGNAASQTGAPANSPTILSVASLDPALVPSSFSNFGKIEIAAPGRDVFSSWPRPQRYNTISGTSMAAPHVAGCAALWAQTSPSLRGQLLWQKLQATARLLPLPPSRVGAGLIQAP